MSDLNSQRNNRAANNLSNQPSEQLDIGRDMLAEELLHNINTTPIGRLLKQIAAMPEIRQEKVLDVRNQINEGKYNLNERLDLALDRVLEELIL
jgi:hypothetical protein